MIVFARVPQLGAVKTRLARDIGPLAAWRFHRNATAAAVRGLGADRRWRLLVALTPDRLAGRARLTPVAAQRTGQGTGDLGWRMARALDRLRPEPALLVGSDVPGLDRGRIARAFRALAAADAVFGPAEDGGFWLIGIRGQRRPHGWFRSVRWSSPHALADTLTNLPPNVRVARLEPLADVDTGADYARLAGKR